MPIQARYRWLYPFDWPQLSAVVRFERAQGWCDIRSPSSQVASCHAGYGRERVGRLWGMEDMAEMVEASLPRGRYVQAVQEGARLKEDILEFWSCIPDDASVHPYDVRNAHPAAAYPVVAAAQIDRNLTDSYPGLPVNLQSLDVRSEQGNQKCQK